MKDALTISGLTKTYKDFALNDVSFSVPSGSIVGLIGENGAGKSTTISAALGLVQKEAGSVSVLGKEELDNEVKERIGVVFDGNNFSEILCPKKIGRVMKDIYQSWDDRTFMALLKKFSLPAGKPIKQFSKGMKMKLAIAVALSHNSKLLILDEATSGLDPVVRDDILDKSKGDNLSINSVSGDINIEGVFKNTEIDTVSSDAKMYAGSDTNQICYESVSGDATIYTHGVRGYNLLHEYSGGKVDEYFEVKEHYKAIFDIYVDTVDGSIDVIDFNDFLKREHKWNTF